MEVFKVAKTKLVVYIHPSEGNEASQAVRTKLSSLLFKFNEVFDGVVLAYEMTPQNTDATTHNIDAKILPGIHPYFGARLRAKLLLFSPKPNMLLATLAPSIVSITDQSAQLARHLNEDFVIQGKVVKLGKESIHVIVLGFCSACITDKDIREEFRYKTKHGKEVYASKSHKRHVIKVGTMIRFICKSMDEEILHISGSLLPSNTGSIKWLAKQTEGGLESIRSDKKRKRETEQ